MQRRLAAVALAAVTAFLLAPVSTAWAPAPPQDPAADVVDPGCIGQVCYSLDPTMVCNGPSCTYISSPEYIVAYVLQNVDAGRAWVEETAGQAAGEPVALAEETVAGVEHYVESLTDDDVCWNLERLDRQRLLPPEFRPLLLTLKAFCDRLLGP